jgi:hypothetical protein
MPRVPAISAKSDVPAEHHAVVDGVMKTFGRIRGPYSMLLHTPLLAKHFLGVMHKETIELIRTKGDPAKLPEDERLVVAFAQQLMRTSKVDQATFDALNKRHGTQWMVELTAMTGYFGALCNIVTNFDVPVPEGGDRLR